MYNNFAKRIPENEHNRKLLEKIKKEADGYIKTPIRSLSFSKFSLYRNTGSRVEYEAEYIEHRKRLNLFTAMALSDPNPTYISELEDIIWAICDESTWVFPAHLPDSLKFSEYNHVIDLFSSETALALSEVHYLLGDRLSPIVSERMKEEVRSRIITPYITKRYRWKKNNWSAVCGACCGMTVMYLGTKQEFEESKNNILLNVEDFLDSYQDDGCCPEGVLYWSYGFGYFCYLAQMLKEYTNGEINLLKRAKVSKIALFGQKMKLNGDHVIPFSDAPHNFKFNIGLNHFLAKNFDGIKVIDEKNEAVFGDDIRYRFADFIRNFFWYDDRLKCVAVNDDFYIMENSQQYIHRKANYIFSAKGGNNGEPHNHNDLGSFIIYNKNGFLLDDLGWQEYDDRYLKAPSRYESICASTKGHSVPALDAKEQKLGATAMTSIVEYDENGICFDLSAAYDIKVERKFTLFSDSINIFDIFEGKTAEICERFVTRKSVYIEDDKVIGDGFTIACDNVCDITIEKVDFNPRLSICKMDMKPVETAYIIQFIVKNPTEKNSLNFKINIK